MLDLIQRDLLKELVNVYVGRAASLLSEMTNQKIVLNVPEIQILNVSEMDDLDKKSEPLFSPGHIVSSSLKFGHNFSGRASLFFPANKAKVLVDICLGEFVAGQNDKSEKNLADTDFDVLRELSNVLLNTVIGEFGNLLGTKLEFSLPNVELIFVSETEQKIFLKHDIYVLVLHTSFILFEADVEGIVLVALGMNSLSRLISKLDEMLGDYDG